MREMFVFSRSSSNICRAKDWKTSLLQQLKIKTLSFLVVFPSLFVTICTFIFFPVADNPQLFIALHQLFTWDSAP